MSATSADNQIKVFPCADRRHMDAEFRVYDAMIAICKSAAKKLRESGKWKPGDPLPNCHAKLATLANMIDRSKVQVGEQLAKLEKGGWIVDLHPDGRQRRRKGDYTSSEYKVLTHEEYVAAHPGSCPLPRYDPETGNPISPGAMTKGLLLAKLRGIDLAAERPKYREALGNPSMEEMPDSRLDFLILYGQSVHYTNATKAKKGNPCLDTEPNGTQPSKEILSRAKKGDPYAGQERKSLHNQERKSLHKPEGVKPDRAELETNLQPARQAPGNEPGAGNNNGGQAGGDVSSSSSSTKNQNQQLWQEFLNQEDLPDEMRCAEPTAEEKQQVLEQLKQVGAENLAMVIDDWKDMQSPPLHTLVYGRWKRWLATGGKAFEEARGYAETDRRNALLKPKQIDRMLGNAEAEFQANKKK